MEQSEKELALKIKEYIVKLNYRDTQSKHYMPNEIFKDLQANIETSTHIAFAYSYYYLISWLYRNVKYGEPLSIEINTKTLKKLLGYNQNYKPINYIIKKNGVLDQLNYTKNDWNFPIEWYSEDNKPEFIKFSDTDEYMNNETYKNRRIDYEIKYPIKHFFRNTEDTEKTGVFYDVSNTHLVQFEVFMQCMASKELGVLGFYLYSFLKYKNQQHKEGYDASKARLAKETGISERAITKYLSALRSYNMINVIHNQEYFILGSNPQDFKASTIKVNEREKFTRHPIDYKKLGVKKNVKDKDKEEEPQKPTQNSSF